VIGTVLLPLPAGLYVLGRVPPGSALEREVATGWAAVSRAPEATRPSAGLRDGGLSREALACIAAYDVFRFAPEQSRAISRRTVHPDHVLALQQQALYTPPLRVGHRVLVAPAAHAVGVRGIVEGAITTIRQAGDGSTRYVVQQCRRAQAAWVVGRERLVRYDGAEQLARVQLEAEWSERFDAALRPRHPASAPAVDRRRRAVLRIARDLARQYVPQPHTDALAAERRRLCRAAQVAG
jgi:hypothetical protein